MVVLRRHVGLCSTRCESHQISMTAPTYTTSPWTASPNGSHGGTRRRLAREPADRAGRHWRSPVELGSTRQCLP